MTFLLNSDQIVNGFAQAHRVLAYYDKYIGEDYGEFDARNLAVMMGGPGMNLDALDRLLVIREKGAA